MALPRPTLRIVRAALMIVLLAGPPASVGAQERPRPTEPKIETLNDGRLRIGSILVDTKRREISVPGVVNKTEVLEFVANTPGGMKAYESALTLDTSAVGFNLALILIGLDQSRAVPPRHHFDPRPPQGDPVEIMVEWQEPTRTRQVRAEELVYNAKKNESLPRTPWVYTGSVSLRNGRYLAEMHGVLIGFVHSPAPIIENPLPAGLGEFGSFQLNPTLNLSPGTAIRLTVRALSTNG